MLVGTVTIPYGFRSPLPGTVEATVVGVSKWERKGDPGAAAAGAPEARGIRAAAAATAANIPSEVEEILRKGFHRRRGTGAGWERRSVLRRLGITTSLN
jgi:hypothetical protein